jgi:hypothetical protein
MMRTIRLFAVVALLVTGGCSSSGGKGPSSALGCRIALGYIKDFKATAIKGFSTSPGRSIGVWRRPANSGIAERDLDGFVKEKPQFAHAPEIARVRAQAKVSDVSVVDACPEVRQWLDQSGVPHDDARLNALIDKKPWPIATLAISMPVFTDAGSTASFIVEEYWAPLGGGIDAITYKRGADGKWRLASRDQLGIS